MELIFKQIKVFRIYSIWLMNHLHTHYRNIIQRASWIEIIQDWIKANLC